MGYYQILACILLIPLCAYFAVELGWGGGDPKDGHPPGPMA